MEVISGVLVDSFTHKRYNTLYFLTHWHADHYMGISNKWPYGPIYCSQTTRRLLLTKYPKLEDIVKGIPLNTLQQIEYGEQGKQLRVKFFDSNHMAGSVMILFELTAFSKIQSNDLAGHLEMMRNSDKQQKRECKKQYFLHTGDMRFNAQILKKQSSLFHLSENQYRCKYNISKLYLDNTYCDPIFQFPNRSDALKLIKNIIDKQLSNIGAIKNKNNFSSLRVFIVTDSVGKEEAFLALSIHYKTKILLSKQRYVYCEAIFEQERRKYMMQTFFVLKDENKREQNTCWIEVIKRSQKEQKMNIFRTKKKEKQIFISLTGWANIQDFHQISDHQYIVPYSLHSNYQQIELCVSAVGPKQIIPIVRHNSEKQSQNFRKVVHSYGSYMGSLMHMRQRGLGFLRRKYCGWGGEGEKQQSEYLQKGKTQTTRDSWLQIDMDSK